MTTYLTKSEEGKTWHFRTIVEHRGVFVVHGVFYLWMQKYWQECDNETAAHATARRMIEEKLQQGYRETPFTETPENNMDIYDKAAWHYEGDFPEDLDNFQGYVHTGMFVGWLIDRDLVSEQFRKEYGAAITQFKHRHMTGAQVYRDCLDGMLLLEDISEIGNRFGIYYFNMENGEYLIDYENTLGMGLPSLYHVQDTWENYFKLKSLLDSRFEEWHKMIN
jgi:hypothetical protein